MGKKKPRPDQKMQAWIDARKLRHLSHAEVQMARELGMNPKTLGKIDNHDQEPWKMPLKNFIEHLYFKRFGKIRPDPVTSIEDKVRLDAEKKARKRARKLERRQAQAAATDSNGDGPACPAEDATRDAGIKQTGPARVQYELAKAFWTTGLQYLIVVENVSGQIASAGNPWVLLTDRPVTPEGYFESTRSSDHAIIIPLLFNLVHGIELIVKGFLLATGTTPKRRHDICDLCKRFMEKYPSAAFNEVLSKYTSEEHMPDLLRRFISENSIAVRAFYESLRYPSPDFNTIRLYSSLMHNDEEGISFFVDLHRDMKALRRAVVSHGQQLDPDAREQPE